jgi:hypothetical protein
VAPSTSTPRAQFIDVLGVAGQPLVEHLVVRRRRRCHQRHAARAKPIERVQQVVGQKREVLDALAVELHQEFLDLAGGP